MNKSLFTSIVLGLDALTIGAFGTAVYESGRPIVGVVFLFTLVIVSGIAFGFTLNQDVVQKPAPKINTTDYTQMGVAIMKQTVKMLEEEYENGNRCPHGLCILLKRGLAHELHTNYDCVTETQMNMVFPFFTYSNAKIYGEATYPSEASYPERVYWWDRGDIQPRIEFLKTMIKWQEEL